MIRDLQVMRARPSPPPGAAEALRALLATLEAQDRSAAPEAQPPPSKAPDSAGPPSAPEDITCFRKGENAYYCHTAWEGYFEMPGRGWKREGKPFKAWTDGAAPPAGAVPIYVCARREETRLQWRVLRAYCWAVGVAKGGDGILLPRVLDWLGADGGVGLEPGACGFLRVPARGRGGRGGVALSQGGLVWLLGSVPRLGCISGHRP